MTQAIVSIEQGIVGGMHAVSLGFFTYTSISSCLPKNYQIQSAPQKENTYCDQVMTRISSGILCAGSVARLVDWTAEVGLFAIKGVYLCALKVIGYGANFFYSLKESLVDIEELNEMEELVERNGDMVGYPLQVKDALNVYRYSKWAKLFANIFFAIGAAVEVAAAITGAVVLSSSMIHLFLIGGLVLWGASFVLKKLSSNAPEVLEFLRAASPKRYSYYG